MKTYKVVSRDFQLSLIPQVVPKLFGAFIKQHKSILSVAMTMMVFYLASALYIHDYFMKFLACHEQV